MSIDSTKMAVKRHELLEGTQAVVQRYLESLDLSSEAATLAASAVVDHLSTYWAGQVISFPKDVAYKLTMKELEIYERRTGRNVDDLARQYGMTPRGMRKLIKRIHEKIQKQNAEAIKAGQLDLLGHSEPARYFTHCNDVTFPISRGSTKSP